MHPSQFRLGVEVWIGNIARHPGGRNGDIFLIKMQGITPLWQAFTRNGQDKGVNTWPLLSVDSSI